MPLCTPNNLCSWWDIRCFPELGHQSAPPLFVVQRGCNNTWCSRGAHLDFGLGNGWASQQLPCLCSPGTAVALLPHEAGNLHPEGTRGLLTEVIIPVSNGSQGTTAECTRRSLQCFKGIPPHSVSGLPLNQSCWRLLQGKRQHQTFSRPMCSVRKCSHLWKELRIQPFGLHNVRL